VWEKQLRPDSGGAGEYRGGLGQTIVIGAREGYEFHFSAMFDRVANAARGREGGMDGGNGSVKLDDGTVLRTKGTQFVPTDRLLELQLPGGGGYGSPAQRNRSRISDDISRGYVSRERAEIDYQFKVEE
jgi:N-methylhydantoinase B